MLTVIKLEAWVLARVSACSIPEKCTHTIRLSSSCCAQSRATRHTQAEWESFALPASAWWESCPSHMHCLVLFSFLIEIGFVTPDKHKPDNKEGGGQRRNLLRV